jgi:hypothetical protein
MADDDVLSMIMKAAHASEGYELRFFQVSVDNGSTIDVRLWDEGPSKAGPHRYAADAYVSPDEPMMSDGYTMSNGGATIEEALAGVHWQNFTKRP